MKNYYIIKQGMGKLPLQKNKAPFLYRLDMELTERCNNNCMHCYINLPANDSHAKNKELSTIEIKNILKEAVSLGCMTVRFTGGEPFLRSDFKELYIFARRQGLKVLLFTNATLITTQLADLFVKIPPLERIEVTVYGMKKESYEAATRSPGSFEVAWRGINLLLKNKIPFVVKGALLDPNKDEIEEFASWAKSLPWMDRRPSYSVLFDLRCRRDNADKNKFIKKLRLKPKDALNILARNKDEYVKEMKEFCSKFMRPAADKLFSCGAGLSAGCVDAYGYFHPCLLLKHKNTAYNLRKGSLKDALAVNSVRLKRMKAVNPDYLKRCAKCFLKGLCEQCPARSAIEHGSLDKPVEYHCDVAHTQARFLGLIKEGEKAWGVEDWQERIRSFVVASLSQPLDK